MRRTALLGLLALAAPLTMTACSQEPPAAGPELDRAASSAPTTPTTLPPVTSIPADFPLAEKMTQGSSDDVRTTLRSVGMRALDFCGRKPLRGLTLTDRRTAEASGNEYAHTRDLMLFADPDPPAAVLADIRSAARSCPADSTGPGSRLLTEVSGSALGDDAATVIHTYEQDGTVGLGAEIIEVVVVGRALLVTSTYAEFDPATNLDDGVADEAARLERTVAAMSLFRNEPTTPSVTSP